MLKKELKHSITMNPEERATAREIVEDAYEDAHSVNGIVYADNPSDRELIDTINDELLNAVDPEDAKNLVALKAELQREEVANWIEKRKEFYSMKRIIIKMTSVGYKRWLNYQNGAVKLSMDELVDIKRAMQAVAK